MQKCHLAQDMKAALTSCDTLLLVDTFGSGFSAPINSIMLELLARTSSLLLEQSPKTNQVGDCFVAFFENLKCGPIRLCQAGLCPPQFIEYLLDHRSEPSLGFDSMRANS